MSEEQPNLDPFNLPDVPAPEENGPKTRRSACEIEKCLRVQATELMLSCRNIGGEDFEEISRRKVCSICANRITASWGR